MLDRWAPLQHCSTTACRLGGRPAAAAVHTSPTSSTVDRTKLLFKNHGPINNPTFVKKVATSFGLGTQLKRMK